MAPKILNGFVSLRLPVKVSYPALSAALQRQGMLDLASRAQGGLFVHIPLWLLLGWSVGLARDIPVFFWSNAALLCASTLIRLRWQPRVAARAADDSRAWCVFLAMLLWNALYWGVLGALAVAWPPLQRAQTAILFIITGVTAAGGMTLAIHPVVRLAYPIAAMAPPNLMMLLNHDGDRLFIGLAAVMFMGYIVLASRAVYDDYWAAARTRAELEQRAQQLERLSITDALTQVHNRQFFERQLGIEWSNAERRTGTLSLLMIDIDHFKAINDDHGHPFGDVCLQAVASALQDALRRPGDVVSRYGGEEFAVLLPCIDHAGAEAVAQRLRAAVAALALTHDGRRVPLTCSIGVHSVPSVAACTAAQVISGADQALYAAKRQGRNRVVASALVLD
jgi:diguanylate cyclase (GGDEF)-like protein